MTLLTRAAGRADRLPWRRYWVRRGGTFEVEHGGFLVTPDAPNPLYAPRNANLTHLDDLDAVRCVLALGDPGLGKSREFEAYATRLHARISTEGVGVAGATPMILAFDVTDFDNREDLRRQVFESRSLVAWKADGVSILYLVLDSLDESLIK